MSDSHVEGGGILDLVDGVESIGRVWLGIVEEIGKRYPAKETEL